LSRSPVVAVTGATGYVGSVIVDALKENAKVLSLVRTPNSADQIRWSFGSDPDLLARTLRDRGVTHLIHSAWDMRANSEDELEQTCVAGSLDLLTAARQAGVENTIFISTLSAFEGARSAYGRSKLKVEEMFRRTKSVILRLGLVYGYGRSGTFANLQKIVRTAPIIPLIGNGTGPIYPLDERTLAEVVRRAVQGDFDGEVRPFTLAHPEPIAFRDLLRRIARSEGRSVVLVPVPWRVLYLAIYSAERCGLKLKVRSDSVLSFVYQDVAPDFSVMRLHSISPIQFSA
jgi:nucleoside-diphosphate-sugar epimerase